VSRNCLKFGLGVLAGIGVVVHGFITFDLGDTGRAHVGVILEDGEIVDGATVLDDDLLGGRGAVEGFDSLDGGPAAIAEILAAGLAVDDGAEDDVLAVQMRGRDGGDEELGAVGVRASVGHGHETGTTMLEGEILISELLAVDGLATGAVTAGEITTLQHEVLDDTMEGGALVAESWLTGGELEEIVHGLGGLLAVETNVDALLGLTANGNVKIDSLGDAGADGLGGGGRADEGGEEKLHHLDMWVVGNVLLFSYGEPSGRR